MDKRMEDNVKMTQLQSKLNDLNLSGVLSRMCREMGLSHEQAELAETRYREFLLLKALHPGESLVPPKLVDHFWHYHLMDTQKYADDCQHLFGSTLHHHPDVTDSKQQAGWNRTKELYLELFGVDIEAEGWGAETIGAAKCD